MKRALLATVVALPGIVLLGWHKPFTRLDKGTEAAAQMPAYAAGQLAGTVLVAPYQVLRSPVGGRVVRTYFSEGQAMSAGAPLLKLTVGAGAGRPVFATAPAAGDLTRTRVRVGEYLPAGTPYARLTPRGPVRVRVAAVDAARLHPGDSLRVLRGPVGLIGHTTPLTALSPDSAAGTVVLELARLGWPPGTAARVVLLPVPTTSHLVSFHFPNNAASCFKPAPSAF